MSDWASPEEIDAARELAEEGLDVLRCIALTYFQPSVLLDEGESPQDAIEHQRNSIRRFCLHTLPRVTSLCTFSYLPTWLDGGEGKVADHSSTLDRILRTIERSCPVTQVYPFGVKFPGDGEEEEDRTSFTTAHEAAIRWAAYEWAAPSNYVPPDDYGEFAQLAIAGESELSVLEDLKDFCAITDRRREELRLQVINEWRAAHDFVASRSNSKGSGNRNNEPEKPQGDAPTHRDARQPDLLRRLLESVSQRLNETDKEVLVALQSLTLEGLAPATNEVIAKQIPGQLTAQNLKPRTGALFRHGVLDKGPDGIGFQISEFGSKVVSLVFPEVRTMEDTVVDAD